MRFDAQVPRLNRRRPRWAPVAAWWLWIGVLLAALAWASPPVAAGTPAGSVISNRAQVSYTTAGSGNLSTYSNTADFVVEAAPSGQLDIGTGTATAWPGAGLHLTFTVANTGPYPLTANRLTLTLPAGSTLVVDAGAPPLQNGNNFTIPLADLSPAATVSVGLTLTLPLTQPAGSVDVPIAYLSGSMTMSTHTLRLNVQPRSSARLELLQQDPSGAAPALVVPATAYDTGGGAFVTMTPPLLPNGDRALILGTALSLLPATSFRIPDVVFVRVTDADQNRDPAVAESITVDLSNSVPGERETLRLTETGPNTGVFLGYVPTTTAVARANDGHLSADGASTISVSYRDATDGIAAAASAALVDPFGRVFDSASGQPLNGVTVSLVDAASGLPATVFGDDGVSAYPATVVTGSTVTDAGGNSYVLHPGNYRFPLIAPGTYRLQVSLPAAAGYRWPSTATDAAVQALPGAPYALGPGSRGAAFTVDPGPPVRIDLPADPAGTPLLVRKVANKNDAGYGDLVGYAVEVENTRSVAPVDGVTVTDVLPATFRYRSGSLRINGRPAADPTISADGGSLTVPIGNLAAAATTRLSYVAQVGAAALGEAKNTASARGAAGERSNTASATVTIRDELMRSRNVLVGSVLVDAPGGGEAKPRGFAGIRIYLEDGSTALTDKDGRFHFEGVRPGTHVVQLDVATLPPGYEVLPVERNTAFAGRPWSQFVDLQGGTLWRTDFHIGPKAAPQGNVRLRVDGTLAGDEVRYRLRLENRVVPLANVRLTLMLPAGLSAVPGSSTLNGKPLADPSEASGTLTYRLSDVAGDWDGEIAFTARLAKDAPTGALATKAVLGFDTPAAPNQRTPVVEHRMPRGDDAAAPPAGAETALVTAGPAPAGQPLPAPASPATPAADEMPVVTPAWLATLAPGRAWLWPTEGHLPPIPAQHVLIEHAPGEKVTLTLQGQPVSALNYEGSTKNAAGTVMVSLWRGINLIEGDNRFEAIITAADGRETARLTRRVHYSGPPAHVEWLKDQSQLAADGVNPPRIVLRLTDAAGQPARRGVTGEFIVEPPYVALKQDEFVTQVMPGAPPDKARYVVGADGIAVLSLQPTSTTGNVRIRLPLATEPVDLTVRLKPSAREWIVVGLAEGTVGYNTVSKKMEPLQGNAAEEGLYEDGRIALFAKGQIKGEWLLTMAYDSKKESPNRANASLFQTINPGTYYTLYGDNSTAGYDAASAKKLYLKIERDTFYALFGDFNTDFTVTTLARYTRSLTGAKAELDGGNYKVTAFASDSPQAFVKDEIRGQGISGLYRLSRQKIVLNSEKISVEVRDRFRSEVIVSSRALARGRDYSIDYDAGTLLFREPLPATDEQLNPVYAIVDYEAFDSRDLAVTWGARGELRLSKELLVGGTVVREGPTGREATLTGVDAIYSLGENTVARAEYATTEGQSATGRADGDAYLVEIEHRTKDANAKVYVREVDEGFGLGQGSNSEKGTRKVGGEVSLRLSDSINVRAQAYQENVLLTGAKRTLVEAGGETTIDRTTIQAGVTAVTDDLGDGERHRSNLATLGVRRPFLDNKLVLRANRDQALGGKGDSTDFPTRTRLGADYLLAPQTTVFAEQEWTSGRPLSAQISRVGLKTTPWTDAEAFVTVNHASVADQGAVGANYGLHQKWQFQPHWSLDGSVERGTAVGRPAEARFNPRVPAAAGSDLDFTAGSVGLTYNPGDWLFNSRVELRNSDLERKRGALGSVQTSPNQNLGLLGSVMAFTTDNDAGERTTRADARLGLVYRPTASRWTVLDRLDLITERNEGRSHEVDNQRLVNNLNANYKSADKWQLAMHYGAKFVRDKLDDEHYSGYVDLIGTELRYALSETWDVGFQANTLHVWSLDQFDYAVGASVGYQVMPNVWVSVGHNWAGFEDKDFSAADASSRGFYVRLRMKFDQQNVKEMLKQLGY